MAKTIRVQERRARTGDGASEDFMKLTRASTYALHAVVYMAALKKEEPTASHIIARKKGIPERFLLKVLKPLVSARVLISVKGPNGGYQLARSPSDISLLDVIEAVDGTISGQAPTGQQDSGGALNRRLEHICNQTAEQVRKQLGKIRISELSSKD